MFRMLSSLSFTFGNVFMRIIAAKCYLNWKLNYSLKSQLKQSKPPAHATPQFLLRSTPVQFVPGSGRRFLRHCRSYDKQQIIMLHILVACQNRQQYRLLFRLSAGPSTDYVRPSTGCSYGALQSLSAQATATPVVVLTYWLMHCRSQCITGHRPLISALLCPVLPSPFSSSWTWSPLSTFPFPDLFSKCFSVASFYVALWHPL